MPRRLLVALASVVALAFAAAPAHAVIVPQKSIKGIKLGLSQNGVRAAAGKPTKARTIDNEIMGRVLEWSYGKTKVLFNGRTSDARVINLETTSPNERTAGGIGVGSTRAQVLAKVKGVKCENDDGFRHCFVGRFLPGRTVTDFRLNKANKVTLVDVGIVID